MQDTKTLRHDSKPLGGMYRPSPLAELFASVPAAEEDPLKASYYGAVADLFTTTLNRALDTLDRFGVTEALQNGQKLAFLPDRKRERLQMFKELERRIAEGSAKPVPWWIALVLEELDIVKKLVQAPPDVEYLLACKAQIERYEAVINRTLYLGLMGERGEKPKARLGVLLAIQDHLAEGCHSFGALLRHFKAHHHAPVKAHRIARPEWTGTVFYRQPKPGATEGRIVQIDATGKETSVAVKTFERYFYRTRR